MADRYIEMRSLLPLSYVNYIEKHNGWEGDLGEEFGYIILWDKEMIQERWETYEVARYLSDRWFPFGSDGGGEMLCFDLESGGDRVFWISFVGMADEEAILRFDSFKDIARIITENQ
jgi:hypothetical protein